MMLEESICKDILLRGALIIRIHSVSAGGENYRTLSVSCPAFLWFGTAKQSAFPSEQHSCCIR